MMMLFVCFVFAILALFGLLMVVGIFNLADDVAKLYCAVGLLIVFCLGGALVQYVLEHPSIFH
jgi:hypothetical protein